MTVTLALFIAAALLFDFLNGFHDSANIVATMIASRALSPRQALTITAIAEFCGPFLFGVAVATTIGSQVLVMPAVPADAFPIIFAALISAIAWNLLTWWFGIPSSSSHALIGGLLGAGLTYSFINHLRVGIKTIDDLYSVFLVVRRAGVFKVLLALFISPALGFVMSYFSHKLILFFARGASPKINWVFKKGQIATAIGLALSHGTNDAQKTMGIMTLGLLAAGNIQEFKVPLWVVAASAAAISLGTATGGWRLIKTLGGKFFKIRPIHGFNVQISSAFVILGAALLGGPVSTTHVVSTAVMGTGTGQRASMVRWGVAKQIFWTWMITIPLTMLFSALVFLLIRKLV
jgi:PiT family inorganic phosphate transporter